MPKYLVGLNFINEEIEASSPLEAKIIFYRNLNISLDFYAKEDEGNVTENTKEPEKQ